MRISRILRPLLAYAYQTFLCLMVDWSCIFWFLKVESASQHYEVLSAPYFFPYCSKDPCIFLHLLHANRAVTISDPLPPNNLIPKHENPRDTLLPFSSLLHTTFSRYFLDSLAQTSLVIDDTLIRAMLPERHTGGLNHILGQKSRKPCTPRALFGLRTVHNLCTSLGSYVGTYSILFSPLNLIM